jgi:hypothetical protein
MSVKSIEISRLENTRIPEAILSSSIRGLGLESSTLGEALGSGRTLLVFLRHFG